MSTTSKKKTRSVDTFFNTLSKHPFLFTALACFLLLPLGLAQASHVTTAGITVEAIVWILASLALAAFGTPGSKAANLSLMVSAVVMAVVFSLMTAVDPNHSVVLFVPFTLWLTQLGIVLYREKALTPERVVLLMILLGVIVRYCYCLKNGYLEMQHDTGTFTGKNGHLAYITYWYENGLKLPDFNVTTRWQFYHPPLHHLLMAALLKLFTAVGMPLDWAQDAIQVLPMLYSALSMVVCFRIFQLVRLKGAGLIVAMAGVCFYPTFIIWSGAYNNDMLTTLFMLLSMLLTLRWAQKPSLLRIVPIALCVGCGMMAKLSAWMTAPAIALVFLWVFFKNIKKPLPFIGQFAVFGVICAPLGLWWQVRNYLTFQIPIAYVPIPGLDSMSVAQVPAAQRLFDFSLRQFTYPFEAFTMYQAPYNEYNPMIGLWKTSLFDELNQPWDIPEMASVFLLIAAALAVCGLIGLLWMLLSRKHQEVNVMTRLFFAVIFLTILISYYAFCFQYPYVCTENIRYCMPLISLLSMGLGYGLNRLLSKD